MKINPEVQEALKLGKPVVALESTIISHGMPYPRNVETAIIAEKTIRECGAVPATMGIINGEPVIGMTKEEIEQFGKREGILKASRRDLPVVFAKKEWAATTVSATMILAHMAGIKVFVTGGIGGVHKFGNESFDISADLTELGKTPVTVVCAGPKAILDLGLTLEYLETQGVPVLGYKTKKLPAFYTPTSEFDVNYQVDSALEIAQIMKEKIDNKLDGGILVCNPIPKEFAMDEKVINDAITLALKDAPDAGIHGKDATPFLLKRIVELTGGDSLESNIHLVMNNAVLGAQIAIEYSKL